MSLDDRRAKAIFSFAGGFKGFPNCGSGNSSFDDYAIR